METEKDILMFYQSAIRNVALFTSVSLALLVPSRFYRGKSRLYNISFIGLSLLFVIAALITGIYLITDVEAMIKNMSSTTYIEKWIFIPYILSITDVLVVIFGLFTLYRESFRTS